MGIGLLAMVSCGGSKKEDEKKEEKAKTAAEINVKDLKEACDYADAMLIVDEEMKNLLDENINVKEEDISEETRNNIDKLAAKAIEIDQAMKDNDIDMLAVKNCDSYKKVSKLEDEITTMMEEKFSSDSSQQGDEALKDLEAEMGEEIETIPR